MTLLGGLFSRKKRREGSVNSTEPDSAVSSPTTAGSHHVPSPSRSPPSKLRLTFGRKKTPDVDTRPHPTRTSTDTHSADVRRLRPPPSRSAIFAAYGDPSGALSTRSLPAGSASDPPRRPSLFAWGNPSPSSPPSESSTIAAYDSPRNSDAHSFNLKSFRHVRPPSPTNLSSSSLAPPLPRPRPRGASVNSDSSQRISVAAFREAQARRSTAGSPVPDFRSPSPNPPMPPQPRSITPEQGRPRPSRSTPHITQQRQRSSMAVTSTSDSDESTSSSENDSEDDTIQVGKPSIYAKQRAKAKSEIGHHAHSPSKPPDLPPYRAPRSHIGHSPSPQQRLSGHELKNNNVPDVLPVVSSQSVPAVRPRASVSTSALTPTAAAKRASILVASNSKLGPPMDTPRSPQLRSQTSRASLATTQARTVQSDSDSEDDAPLATLMGPRRPGSAMSSYSNLHSRSTGNVTTRSTTSHHRAPNKPLIDINELTRAAPQRSYTSPNTSGFTEGPTLLSQSPVLNASRALSASPPPMVESLVSTPPWRQSNDAEPLTRTVPPLNFISPPASPAKDMFSSTPDIDIEKSSGGGRVISGEPNDLRRDTSPEPRRDPITDRLTRAVKKNLQPTFSSGGSSSSVVTAQNGSRRSASRELNPGSGDASDGSRAPPRKNMESARAAEVQQQAQTRYRPPRSQMPFPTPSKATDEHSPLDEELAQLLGTAVHFISRTGNTPPPVQPQGSSESSESESDEDEDEDEDGFEKIEKEIVERIAPIPIKQRSPPPSFSVTSRPPLTKREGNANADSYSNSTTSPPRSEASSGSGLGGYTRPRSSTLIATSSSSSSKTFGYGMSESISAPPGSSQHKSAATMGNLINFPNGNSQTSTTDQRPSTIKSSVHVRQRSVTMVTGVPLSAQMPTIKKPTSGVPDKPFNKPFNGGRRNSPASSTGDSSSGRAPITPRDGSDVGVPRGEGNSKQQQHHQQPKKHVKRRSVSFEDDMEELKPPNRKHFIGGSSSARGSSEGGDTSNEEDREVKRRERRRSEAKAAIELGNVINGKGPIVDDDDDMPINQTMNPRMSSLNPMMAMGNPMAMQMGFGSSPNLAPGGWGGQSMGNMNMGMGGAAQMLSPAQFMVPPPADPNFLAAHQHAMMIAKQAYQMAVAQQAMAAAADEWERGSTVGGFSGGGGGSVYGGSGVNPAAMMQSQFGMMGMMQGGGGGGWPASASVYGASRSMYGGSQLGLPMDGMMSSSRSEFGAATNGRGGTNWSSSRSTYGESFGPAQDQYTRRGPQQQQQQQQGMRRSTHHSRDSGYFPPVPPMPAAQGASGRNSPDGRPRTKPSSPSSPGRGSTGQRKAPPPSSWKLAM